MKTRTEREKEEDKSETRNPKYEGRANSPESTVHSPHYTINSVPKHSCSNLNFDGRGTPLTLTVRCHPVLQILKRGLLRISDFGVWGFGLPCGLRAFGFHRGLRAFGFNLLLALALAVLTTSC